MLYPSDARLIEAGLYEVSQYREAKGVHHTAILDMGNRLRLPSVNWYSGPVVIHLDTTGLKIEWAQQTGPWEIRERAVDEAAAVQRLYAAFQNPPRYHTVVSNCEHFTQMVLKGTPQSRQVQNSFWVTLGLVGGLYLLSKAGRAA